MFISKNQIEILHHALYISKHIQEPINIYAEPIGNKARNYWAVEHGNDIPDNIRQYYVCTVKNY